MNSQADSVLEAVSRSNQRGGRMLSVIDLLQAGTLTMGQLCWLLAQIEQGASWLVGAQPGGAGKTTVMSALLGMLPAEERVWIVNPGSGWETCQPGDCVVAYEISRGRYDGYIWGADLVRLCALGDAGCRIVTNLHADTLAQAREQIVSENRVPEAHLRAFDLFIPIRLDRRSLRVRRRVPHMCRATRDGWCKVRLDQAVLSEREAKIAAFVQGCLSEDWYTVADVRQAWLGWCQIHPV